MYGHRARPTRRQSPAFTVIELLVVMAIIVILAGMAITFWPTGPSPAGADILRISAALDLYRADFGAYPPDTGYGLAMDAGSPHYDPGSLWRYLRTPLVDPRTGRIKTPYLTDWSEDRTAPYEDPVRGKSCYLTDPWGNPFGFIGDRRRVIHNPAGFDLFSAGRDGETACGGTAQSPGDTRPGANRAYNGKDDDGNGIVDDSAELGAAAANGTLGDDSSNWRD
jgi:prepilin-type N-terminal cleavage/methylation domain-containing protein